MRVRRDFAHPGRWLPLLALGVAWLAAACSSTTQLESIQGQLNEVQRQLLQIQTQGSSKGEVEELQAVIAEEVSKLVRSQADTQVEVARLIRQIERLQAKLEDTDQRLNQVSQQIASTNQELKTLRALPRLLMGESPAPEPPQVPSDPEQIYQSAYNDYLRANYDLAILGFRQYVETFPDTDLADNALYWIGECYFSQGKYRQAIGEFSNVEELYPNSERVASALLKKGFAHLEIDERAQGTIQLQKVIRDYPSSDERILAEQRLESLGGNSD